MTHPLTAAVLLALVLASVASCAAEPARRKLPPNKQTDCRDEGGCVWVSQEWLKERMEAARDAGREEGVSAGKAGAMSCFRSQAKAQS